MYDGRAALEMIHAVYESPRLKGPVPLPLVTRSKPLTILSTRERAMKQLLIPTCLFVLLANPLLAQDVTSGPAKGSKVAALKVYDATGLHKEKTIDYVAERKDRPTIYLLLQADRFDRPMNRLMKTLDSQIKKDHPAVYAVAVWLTEDLEK